MPYIQIPIRLLLIIFLPGWLSAQQKNDLVPYRNGQYWGLADGRTGKIVLAPTLDSIGWFSNSPDERYPLVWVKKNGQYGLVNRQGKWVLPAREYEAGPIGKIGGDFFYVRRYSQGARSYDEEASKANALNESLVYRPVAFFDSIGYPIGQPFEYAFSLYLDDTCGGGWEDANGFDKEWQQYYEESNSPFSTIWKNKKAGVFDLKNARLAIPPIWDEITVLGNHAIVSHTIQDSPNIAASFSSVLVDLLTGKQIKPSSDLEFGFQRNTHWLVAKNKKSGLYGFIDWNGKIVVPCIYKNANPYSSNGLTMVETVNGIWRLLDKKGRLLPELKPNESIAPSGEKWVVSDQDHLMRKAHTLPEDEAGRVGLSRLPVKTTFNNRPCLYLHRGTKVGLAAMNGKMLLWPDLDGLDTTSFAGMPAPDSMLQRRYFSVLRGQRRWVYDSRTFKPVGVRYISPAGKPGNAFAEGDFSLILPVSGDSLFVIQYFDGKYDVLNARNGKTWGLENASRISIQDDSHKKSRLIRIDRDQEGSHPRYYDLLGRHVPYFRIPNNESEGEKYGYWYYAYDASTGYVSIFDSTGQTSGAFIIPFAEENNRIELIPNRNGRCVSFALLARAPSGASAVFLPSGARLSPLGLRDIQVAHDLIFAKKEQGQGVFSLFTGREIVPAIYSQIYQETDGTLVARDVSGTEILFDQGGHVLFIYPRGYAHGGGGVPGPELHLIHSKYASAYLKNRKEVVVFPDVKYGGTFEDGFAAVTLDNGCHTYIRPDGSHINSECYIWADAFKNARAIVSTSDSVVMLIDTTGKAVIRVPMNRYEGSNSISMLESRGLYYKVTDPQGHHIFDRDGTPLLMYCSFVSKTPKGDSILFIQEQKPGWVLPDGQIKWAAITDYTRQGARRILNGSNSPIEGVYNDKTGQWVVLPKYNQSVSTPPEIAPLMLVSQENEHKRFAIDVHTGIMYLIESGYMDKVDGVGWIVENYDSEKAFLYSTDLKTVRPWNINFSILWNENKGLYEVKEDNYALIGYISRTGHFFFEN